MKIGLEVQLKNDLFRLNDMSKQTRELLQIFFHNPYNKIYEITIYNNVGQIVYQSNSVINKIDVKLKSGIYYVQCKYQGIYENEKLIVE
jgi:hypothetical protein